MEKRPKDISDRSMLKGNIIQGVMPKCDNKSNGKYCSQPEMDKGSQGHHAESNGGNNITGIVMKGGVEIPGEPDERELQQDEPKTACDKKKGSPFQSFALHYEIDRRASEQDECWGTKVGNQASGK